MLTFTETPERDHYVSLGYGSDEFLSDDEELDETDFSEDGESSDGEIETDDPLDTKASPSKKRHYEIFSEEATKILKKWFGEHLLHPYPNSEEKDLLAIETGLTPYRVRRLFAVNFYFIFVGSTIRVFCRLIIGSNMPVNASIEKH